VKPLERRGCLRIVPGRTLRERVATLTAKGRGLLARALSIWERVQERLVDALGADTWATLAAALGRVVPTVRAIESGESATAARRRRTAPRLAEPQFDAARLGPE
jgi:DNA-binding PadR family transcriptional regulator